MRKRSKYRPKAVLPDPLSYVLKGFVPITAVQDENTKLRIKNHSAIEDVRTGAATKHSLDVLINSFNMAETLAVMGIGDEYLPEIHSAQDALREMIEKGIERDCRFLFTGQQLQDVVLGMEVHDAQLDRATLGELQQALRLIVKMQAQGKVDKIKVPEKML